MGESKATSFDPLWADTPSAHDLLGYADIAAAVVDAIRRERLDPVAIGVLGVGVWARALPQEGGDRWDVAWTRYRTVLTRYAPAREVPNQ
jgi:hypothetical protein